MHLTFTDLQTGQYVVTLNNRRIAIPLEADDNNGQDNGWVDILDPATLAPIQENSSKIIEGEEETMSSWERAPRKRLYGQVKLYKIERKK